MVTYSCKKNDSGPPSKSSLLTSGSWVLTDAGTDSDGDGWVDQFDFQTFEPCYIDNFYVFHTDGKLELNEGATKCSENDPQTDVSVWQLVNNETELIFGADTYTIDELTATRLGLVLHLDNNRSSLVTFSKR
jgi:hypothetical protein